MTARKCCEDQLSGVRMARVHRQLRAVPDRRNNRVHVVKLQLRIDALTIEVHRHSHDIHVACALAVTHQGTLNTVSARHDA